MAIIMEKGGNINLSKEQHGLKIVQVGLGWDAQANGGQQADLDGVAVLLNAEGKLTDAKSVIYYANLSSANGAVVHSGDNLTGHGDGDDEQITINLEALPAEVEKVVVAVNIHQAAERGQNFGQVKNAYVRISNQETSSELAKFDLGEDASTSTQVAFAEVYKHNGEWKFRALGEGVKANLQELAAKYQ